MTRDDWYVYIESVPPTSNQLGRAHAEMTRLGINDRAERLAVTSMLLDLETLDSFTNLTQGQAGRLVNLLCHTRTRAELPEITTAAVDGSQDGNENEIIDDQTAGRITERPREDLVTRIAMLICETLRGAPARRPPQR